MQRCETCKHWLNTDAWDVKSAGLKRCNAVRPKWKVEDDIPEEVSREGKWSYEGDEGPLALAWQAATLKAFSAARAVVNDGSQYIAELLTRPDFGCVLHEDK